jgi:hypothetical protein
MKTQPVSITIISWLFLFREMIDVYSETQKKPTNIICGIEAKLTVIADGTCSHQCALKS